MKYLLSKAIISCTACIVLLISCTPLVDDNESDLYAFKAFWNVMDENYVYFELKELDWDEIYDEYLPRFEQSQSHQQTVELFQEIITTINDGHVYLTYRDEGVISYVGDTTYLNLHYELMQLRYGFIEINYVEKVTFAQLPNDIAYIRLSFEFEYDDYIRNNLASYKMANGLIVDMRDCFGGYYDDLNFCQLFHSGKKVLCFAQYKNGHGHNDFTEPFPVYSEGNGFIAPEIPLVVLTNRNTYSLGNTTTSALQTVRPCTFIGEKTGGGGGSVNAVHLTGGWTLNYTFSRKLSAAKEFIEEGIEPDIVVAPSYDFWQNEHWDTGEDPQLEKALEILK